MKLKTEQLALSLLDDTLRGGRTMQQQGGTVEYRWRTLATASICFFAACLAVTPALATTAPGSIRNVHVILTANAIAIPKAPVSRYPRGTEVAFILANRGTRTVSVQLKLTSKTHVSSGVSAPAILGKISPGATKKLQVAFVYRSTFALELVIAGKVRASHPIIVF